MTRYIKIFIVTLAIAGMGMAGLHAAAATGGVSGISGSISDRARLPLAGVAVPLRNIENGEIVGRTQTDRSGRFSFSGLGAGQYIVEVVGVSGDLVAASTPISVTSEKPAVNAMVLSVPSDRSVAFQTTAAQISSPPIAGQILRAAVLAGIKGSSISVNQWRHSGGVGNGRPRGNNKDSDTDKRSKTPKDPRDDSDSDTDR